MKPRFALKKNLHFLIVAALAAGSGSLIASPDDDDHPGQGGGGDGGQGGDGNSNEALTVDFVAIPPTGGKGDGHYFPFSGGKNIAFNADVRLALEKIVEDGDNVVLNTHLGITDENRGDVAITLFIGTDEDGDGSCLQEGPTSICVFEGGGGEDDLINEDGILHAAWALALRADSDGDLSGGGTGVCYTNFDSTEVIPQFDDLGNMTSVVFHIEGGEDDEMPVISDGDGCMVGFGAPWSPFSQSIECGAGKSCEIIPIMMGGWEN